MAIKTRPKPVTKRSFSDLRNWNLSMAVLHAAQGIAILALSATRSLAVTTNFLTTDPLLSQNGHPVLVAATHHLFDVNLAYIVAVLFFITAIAHVLIATTYRHRYEKNLKNGINRARWIEYGISGAIMMVAIGLLSGIYDFSSLMMIFALVLIMSLLGLVMEVHNQITTKTNWLSYSISCIAGIVPWLVLVIYLVGASVYGNGHIPTFVYWIAASMLLLFTCFAVNLFLQYKKTGKWADYLYGERVYMVLSLIAKSALAWQIFAGTLRH